MACGFLSALAACGVDPDDPLVGDGGDADLSSNSTVVPALHVSGITFANASGSEVVLRGVDVQGDAPATTYQQAAALGANFLRVVTHWDEAELQASTGSGTNWPSYTHHWNATYLAKLDALVAWADAHHIYVLIDFHQASWSPYFGGFGGVPDWYYRDPRFAGGTYAAGTSSPDKGRAIAAFWTTEATMSTHNNLRNTGPGGQHHHGNQVYQEALHSVWIAKAHGAGIPLVLGEWGCNENDTGNGAHHSDVVRAAAKVGLSWSRWQLAASTSSAATLNLSQGTTSYNNLKTLLATVPPGTAH